MKIYQKVVVEIPAKPREVCKVLWDFIFRTSLKGVNKGEASKTIKLENCADFIIKWLAKENKIALNFNSAIILIRRFWHGNLDSHMNRLAGKDGYSIDYVKNGRNEYIGAKVCLQNDIHDKLSCLKVVQKRKIRVVNGVKNHDKVIEKIEKEKYITIKEMKKLQFGSGTRGVLSEAFYDGERVVDRTKGLAFQKKNGKKRKRNK